MTYTLDTNTVIHFFKGMGRVADSLLSTPPSSVSIPSVVVHELEFGVMRSANPVKRREQLMSLLDQLTILPFGKPEAVRAAAIRADLEARGEPIGPLDVLIAGTSIEADTMLVTRNVSEFSRVDGLRIVNWFD